MVFLARALHEREARHLESPSALSEPASVWRASRRASPDTAFALRLGAGTAGASLRAGGVVSWALALLVLFAAGCRGRGESSGAVPAVPKFNHPVHVDADIECVTCHATVLTGDVAGLPAIATCLECHEKDEKSPELLKLVFERKEAGGAAPWDRPVGPPEGVTFSHETHAATKGIACTECHGDVPKSRTVPRPSLRMAECVACHEQKGAPKDCRTCHTGAGERWKPGSHDHAWKQFHGGVVRSGSDRTENRCSLCHTDTWCVTCHQDEEPENHTPYWRHRGHSVGVSMNRDRCATCHRADFCDRCHSVTAPRNHEGAWGSPRQGHCLTCHFPLRNEGCVVCHRDGAQHVTAIPKPTNAQHLPTSDATCRNCHDVIGLPHYDNGDNCGNCHR